MTYKSHGITAVITTFNRCRFLERALNSVVRQSLQPQQVIVIDDGSSDNSDQMVQEKFPCVEYIYQENAGISAARNRGIAMARYPWIAFLDSDDEWHPEKLARQMQAVAAYTPGYRICHTDEIWIRNGRHVNPKNIHRKSGGDIFTKCLPLCVISPSAVILHHRLFQEYGLFDEKLPVCEDYDMWLRICAGEQVLYLEEKLVTKHGGHKDQLSHRYWGMDRFRIQSLENLLNSDRINPEQRTAAAMELKNKLKIYITGAVKRSRTTEIQRYTKKYEKVMKVIENGR